jgi:glycerol-3-phosphate dehydrogenase (NAD(P)+)
VQLVGEGEMAQALEALTAAAGAPRVDGDADVQFWAVPVGQLAATVVARRPGPGDRVVLATRGLEHATGRRPSEIVLAGSACLRVGALGGPLLPAEIRRGSPCAAVVASPFDELTALATAALRSSLCRAYASPDLVGVELASALVDVFAVALGAARGLGLGTSAEALLVARAAVEGARLARRIGGDARTFSGLAGVGDLVACAASADHPGHRRGLALARGERLAEVTELAAALLRHAPSLPIVGGVRRVASGEAAAADVLGALMASAHVGEWDDA